MILRNSLRASVMRSLYVGLVFRRKVIICAIFGRVWRRAELEDEGGDATSEIQETQEREPYRRSGSCARARSYSSRVPITPTSPCP